ncbi:Alpha/beta hydrolase domain-containing protein 17C [Plecturocebus cupreus]
MCHLLPALVISPLDTPVALVSRTGRNPLASDSRYPGTSPASQLSAFLLPHWACMAHLPQKVLVTSVYGVSPENIILYGQSIGTVPTVDLASRYECAAVILHSPLMSGLRVAFPDTRKTYCFDAFPRGARIHPRKLKRVRCSQGLASSSLEAAEERPAQLLLVSSSQEQKREGCARVLLCCPGWNALAPSQLTATSRPNSSNSPASAFRAPEIISMPHHARLIFICTLIIFTPFLQVQNYSKIQS